MTKNERAAARYNGNGTASARVRDADSMLREFDILCATESPRAAVDHLIDSPVLRNQLYSALRQAPNFDVDGVFRKYVAVIVDGAPADRQAQVEDLARTVRKSFTTDPLYNGDLRL